MPCLVLNVKGSFISGSNLRQQSRPLFQSTRNISLLLAASLPPEAGWCDEADRV